MPFYAMVVVVETDEASKCTMPEIEELRFIGDPWKVQPTYESGDFDTPSALAQHPSIVLLLKGELP